MVPVEREVGQRCIAFSDVNADGLVDAVSTPIDNSSRKIIVWFNSGDPNEPNRFVGCDALGNSASNYSVSLGDLNNDGFNDLVSEPHSATPFVVLLNRGLAGCDPNDDPFEQHNCIFNHCASGTGGDCPTGDSTETACWGDTNGDGYIDLFLPAYHQTGTHGNFFFENRPSGPTSCQPSTRKLEAPSGTHGLESIEGSSSDHFPEGAQFCDYDGDGDLDVFVFNWRPDGGSGCVHQNRTATAGGDSIFAMLGSLSAGFDAEFDEGLLLCDVDLDGDFDILRLTYRGDGGAEVNILQSRGDGTLVLLAEEFGAQKYGFSVADFDLDGDYDVMRAGQLVRNDFFDATDQNHVPGEPGNFDASGWVVPGEFINFDSNNGFHISAWADVDGDGDLDVALAAFAASGFSEIYENLRIRTDPDNPNDPNLHTPENDRRFVKVRPVKAIDDPDPNRPAYTENEFGAVAEIVIAGDAPGLRRRQFTASSSGYLNQNEYMLTFGLPPDPTPSDAETDLTFSVCVDFPAHPNAGIVRVDRTINGHLGSIQLKDLYGTYREITVWRDGRVKIGENVYDPAEGEYPSLSTAGGPLVLPDGENAMPALIDADDPNDDEDHSFVALRFTHVHDTGNVRIREIILDGVLAAPDGNCDNIVLVRMPEPMSFSPTPTAV